MFYVTDIKPGELFSRAQNKCDAFGSSLCRCDTRRGFLLMDYKSPGFWLLLSCVDTLVVYQHCPLGKLLSTIGTLFVLRYRNWSFK